MLLKSTSVTFCNEDSQHEFIELMNATNFFSLWHSSIESGLYSCYLSIRGIHAASFAMNAQGDNDFANTLVDV